ncbi:RNA polymerase sigma factor [Arthrobacter sp. 2MCAF14]|uniref:RNA polymerase sigma factor n=1 Tax=Arthrobacter sp. 2MCAF14 TaxID=3232982 RepID=UPI003F92906A
MPPTPVEGLLRELAPQVLGRLIRRYRQFDTAEDAVQDALIKAVTIWPEQGVPANPAAWLYTVASNRLIDLIRSEAARRTRDDDYARDDPAAVEGGNEAAESEDDTLDLLFLCCHDALTPSSQIALTLRAVGGLTTAEIASAYLVPESTMVQRISRAKQTIKAAGAAFGRLSPTQRQKRSDAVKRVLYLMFNEGYTATAGNELIRVDLSAEAVRLTRQLVRLQPDDGESIGMLCLMLLTDARRPARTTPDGDLVPLDEQDRSLWNRQAITEATELLVPALKRSTAGPYLIQAAIAAIHADSSSTATTDWEEILQLYSLLDHMVSNPMVTLNRAVALAMVDGPEAALRLLDRLEKDPIMAGHYRLTSVRAHLLELSGDFRGAREAYRAAALATLSSPERRYLQRRADRL